MRLVVARCESCGAALRLDPERSQVTCNYCQVTSYLRDAPPNAPRITIAPPVEPLDETRLTLMVGVVCGGLALGALVVIIVGVARGTPGLVAGGAVLALLFGSLAVLAFIGYPRKKQYLAEVRRLREHGLPGRATVRSLGAGAGLRAKLQLHLEVQGDVRDVAHETAIPALLVPKMTSGAALPVLVHPDDPNQIEIQWHLL